MANTTDPTIAEQWTFHLHESQTYKHGFYGDILVTLWSDGTAEIATRPIGQRSWGPPAYGEHSIPLAGGDFLLFEEVDQ